MPQKKKTARLAGLILASALAALPLALVANGTSAAERREATIIVTGEGDAALVPDMAIVSLSVNKMAPTAGEALKANAEAMSAVIAALKKRGIEDRDLQTSGLSINPQYHYPDQNSEGQTAEPTLIGYQVINSLSVRLRDVAKTGEVLDEAVTLGINQSAGITFLNSDTKAAEAEARKAAVKAARDKAEGLAEAAGVKLGRLVEMSENLSGPQPMPMMADAMVMKSAAPSTPVAVGESNVHVQVNMTFAIAE